MHRCVCHGAGPGLAAPPLPAKLINKCNDAEIWLPATKHSRGEGAARLAGSTGRLFTVLHGVGHESNTASCSWQGRD